MGLLEGSDYFPAHLRPVQRYLQAGVPVGRIDVDITDPGYVGKEELRSQLTTFFEILESRKG